MNAEIFERHDTALHNIGEHSVDVFGNASGEFFQLGSDRSVVSNERQLIAQRFRTTRKSRQWLTNRIVKVHEGGEVLLKCVPPSHSREGLKVGSVSCAKRGSIRNALNGFRETLEFYACPCHGAKVGDVCPHEDLRRTASLNFATPCVPRPEPQSSGSRANGPDSCHHIKPRDALQYLRLHCPQPSAYGADCKGNAKLPAASEFDAIRIQDSLLQLSRRRSYSITKQVSA